MKYANRTRVTPGKSREEIEYTLRRYGASGFGYAEQAGRAAVQFDIANRRLRIVLRFLPRGEFDRNSTGGTVSREQGDQMHASHVRQAWRALALVIKAKLEAVESGITTVEAEFAAFVVLPDGRTVGEWLSPQIEQAYETGRMPPMLPGLPAPGKE